MARLEYTSANRIRQDLSSYVRQVEKLIAEDKRSVETPEKIAEGSVEERRAKWEREKLTRRQSLARFGFLAGAAAVAALTTDDLARMVGKELQKRAGDNRIVGQVAKELQAAGIAEAKTTPGPCTDFANGDISKVTTQPSRVPLI